MLRAATRGSELALAQVRHVASLLEEEVEEVVVETTGDRDQQVPIWEIGGRGVFVKEVQSAVLDGRADIAVHSAKDLPAGAVPGLVLAAVPERDDARDALVGRPLEDLPAGALVATGAVRRRAQLVSLRPDLTFASLRGNVDTRLRKASQYSAAVLAAAALRRLGRIEQAAEIFDPRLMVPQVAQGALAVECREDDDGLREKLAAIEHQPSRRAVDAERAYLAELGGGCDLPVGAHAQIVDGTVRMTAILASLDGRIVLRSTGEGDDPEELGRSLAKEILDESGGTWLLEGASRA
ncbi:MAG: hydroxymethylbilane synthase [Actinomycetota bacterium]|nr:hydroxymethylbilane synthase [Actinomycetota bacterium]MDQ3574793.1 hydroxymethylbilane synthase [Actinomycetota bacterium]